MNVYDPLYGRFCLPPYLSQLVVMPEVRRLSQIRLLNTVTPSLATLGELRRYSHTLGVLHLCASNGLPGYSEDERRALEASVLLHDVGTPPFGHLLEYHLREKENWSHEKIIDAVLWGNHVPENRAHQIFAGRTIEFRSGLKKSGVSIELVEAIVQGKHPLSLLLFGTMDFDNLDNVARMSWALGMEGGAKLAALLAKALTISREGHLQLEQKGYCEPVHSWAALRRASYEVIAFDAPTVAAQAVLSEAIAIAIQKDVLSVESWTLSDEGLVETLLNDPDTKPVVSREYLGHLPLQAFCIQINASLTDLALDGREDAKKKIERALRKEFRRDRVLGYVFIDHGTFEKQVSFYDPVTSSHWEVGSISESIILYGFVRSRIKPSVTRCKRACNELLQSLSVPRDQLVRYQIGESMKGEDDQQSFNLAYP